MNPVRNLHILVRTLREGEIAFPIPLPRRVLKIDEQYVSVTLKGVRHGGLRIFPIAPLNLIEFSGQVNAFDDHKGLEVNFDCISVFKSRGHSSFGIRPS